MIENIATNRNLLYPLTVLMCSKRAIIFLNLKIFHNDNGDNGYILIRMLYYFPLFYFLSIILLSSRYFIRVLREKAFLLAFIINKRV